MSKSFVDRLSFGCLAAVPQALTVVEQWHSKLRQRCTSQPPLGLHHCCRHVNQAATILHLRSEKASSYTIVLHSRVNLVGFWVSFAWGRIWMTGHGVVASYGLHGTHPWLSAAGTAFGVLFFAMNVGGGVLVWMRETGELRNQPQRTPFWMLESRNAFDNSVVSTSRNSADGKTSARQTPRRRRVSRSPSSSPRRMASPKQIHSVPSKTSRVS